MAGKNKDVTIKGMLRDLQQFQLLAELPEKLTKITYGITNGSEEAPRIRIKTMFGFRDKTFKDLIKKKVLDELDRDIYNECDYEWNIVPFLLNDEVPSRLETLMLMCIDIRKAAQELMMTYSHYGLDIKMACIADSKTTKELKKLTVMTNTKENHNELK